MLTQLIKFGALAGAGYAAWRVLKRRQVPSFFVQALQSGAAEVEVARSAQLRGAGAALRSFALRLEREHHRLNEQLAEASGLDIPPADTRQRAALHRLDLHQGTAYDRAWLRHMKRSHRLAIGLYEREVEQDGPGAAIAGEALPMLREHASRVAELRRERVRPVGLRAENWAQPDESEAATPWRFGDDGAEAGARG